MGGFRARASKRNVRSDGFRKQKRLLRHESNRAAQRRQRQLANISAVDE